MKNHSQTTRQTAKQKRIEQFRKIYIQEYLRNYRPEVIIRAISEKYIIPEQTIRDYIKPARLKDEIHNGIHKYDPNYKSIISC
jgi:hypothetical protein